MAKKRKKAVAPPRNKSKVSEAPAVVASVPAADAPVYDRILWWSAALMLPIMLLLSLQTGINGDDKFQNDYSEKLVDFYFSLGQDQAALDVPQGKMHYYGGFFDLTTGVVNRALGFDRYDAGYHRVRHLFNALFGFLAMLFTALTVRTLAGSRAAILTLLFIFLSPRFFGHSLMNPKDIPFAAGYIIALYFLIRLLSSMPRPARRDLLGFTAGAALAIATRAGGLMLFGFLGLFFFLDFLQKRKTVTDKNLPLTYLKIGAILTAASYVLALFFWPFGLVNPLAHPMEALSEFSKLGVRIRVLFAGEAIMSDNEPWYYLPVWMYRTIPLFVTVGFCGSFLFLKKHLRDDKLLSVSLLWFAALFPVVYIAAKESLLHDGWRHLLFVYPPVVAAAALFWVNAEKIAYSKKALRYGLYGILAIAMLESAVFIGRYPTLSYTYFQPLTGGLAANYGHYETDYWGLSMHQAVNWLEDEGIVGQNMSDTVTVATSFHYPAQVYLRQYPKVKVIYSRFQGRYSQEWDYGIFPTRFINAAQVRKSFPPTKTVHSVTADGIPLSVIIHEKEKYAYRAERALMQRDTIYAVDQFQKELTAYPDNEQSWLGMADAYYGSGDYEKVLYSAEEALRIAPENVSGMYFKGLALAGMNRPDEAREVFLLATQTDSEFYIAYFYLGVLAMERGDLKTALNWAKQTLEIQPDYRNGHLLVAEIYTLAGQKDKADAFLRKMERFRK